MVRAAPHAPRPHRLRDRRLGALRPAHGPAGLAHEGVGVCHQRHARRRRGGRLHRPARHRAEHHGHRLGARRHRGGRHRRHAPDRRRRLRRGLRRRCARARPHDRAHHPRREDPAGDDDDHHGRHRPRLRAAAARPERRAEESVSAGLIADGGAFLGIELGSTRIKACLATGSGEVLATGTSAWENELVDGRWTYALGSVEAGLRAAYASLVEAAEAAHGVRPTAYAGIGISAMMHGYLAFDAAGELLVPFRTWRNTSTAAAAAALSESFGRPVPQRWSAAHLYQAVLDREAHVPAVARLTTLAGYVHERLTGRDVLGVGDASGVFPIDPATGDYDAELLARFDALAAEAGAAPSIAELLPEVLPAGADAGTLTETGAALLDPSGALRPGAPCCPPEGDAGTGMVATNAVRPRTGNVSAGTSVFAMVVLDGGLDPVPDGIDVVTTPAGSPVAMVHCNNGSSELGAWARVFSEFARAIGHPVDDDAVFAAMLGGASSAAIRGDAAEGLLAYNLLAGEPIVGLPAGRPLLVRTPDARLDLAGLGRAQLYSVFAALSTGMRTLAEAGVGIDRLLAHGGLFRTDGVAQQALANALDAPVSVGEAASEGGAWGMALLAAYRGAVAAGARASLADWLDSAVFAGASARTVEPDAGGVAAFDAYRARWEAGLPIVRAAVAALD
ncbi:MAG: ATPase [Microbacteriaceae bacterium]|nr:ATPase [Microbacteriaceae bacterium]